MDRGLTSLRGHPAVLQHGGTAALRAGHVLRDHLVPAAAAPHPHRDCAALLGSVQHRDQERGGIGGQGVEAAPPANRAVTALHTTSHFARPGNRFYPALAAAGIIDRVIDAGSGMTEADREHLLARGIGITNIVARASAGTGHGELSAAELREEAAALAERVAAWRPPPGQQA